MRTCIRFSCLSHILNGSIKARSIHFAAYAFETECAPCRDGYVQGIVCWLKLIFTSTHRHILFLNAIQLELNILAKSNLLHIQILRTTGVCLIRLKLILFEFFFSISFSPVSWCLASAHNTMESAMESGWVCDWHWLGVEIIVSKGIVHTRYIHNHKFIWLEDQILWGDGETEG